MSAVEQETIDDNQEQPAKERIILNVGGVRVSLLCFAIKTEQKHYFNKRY